MSRKELAACLISLTFMGLIGGFLIFISGCSSLVVKPQTPRQAIYSLTGDYAAALTVAVAYAELPGCEVVGHPVVCRDVRTLNTLKVYDNAAYAAILAAQAAANLSREDAQSARLDAIIAVANLVQAVGNLKTK